MLADFSYGISVLVSIVGMVSSTSWVFACWPDIARAWNKIIPF